ncbi:MAG: bifunctional pyr operon transcriptional regulator/uracil phosphoribosyltransferase PyrR [Ruminococcaceae bacterium]|nr:bifunctional pyr operon transcriptional regulator/uracil phosphoribosyltransferase PyrR [Oscillospiraceae bacterium]
MELKSKLMDGPSVKRALVRISHEIIERNRGTEGLAFIGIRRRGVPLARELANNILTIENAEIPVGELDITLYRDDLTEKDSVARVNSTNVPFDVTGRKIILVDDVFYTGRTVRAAIEGIFSLGRPESIQLAILIDRGHRQLPFRADYIGKNIPTSHTEFVKVMVPDIDGESGVCLYNK